MAYFDILTDSTCDLTVEQAEQQDVSILPVGVNVGSSSFMHYADWRELSSRDFYAALRSGLKVGTSATPPACWLDAMEASLKKDRDVVAVPLAATLTAGYNNACIAAAELREDYPDRKIIVIDSVCASLGTVILLKQLATWRVEGMSAQEAAAHAESSKMRIVHMFTVDSLDHLRRGGRISAASAIMGSVLSVKPVLNFDTEGKISVISKARGRKNAIREVASYAEKHALGEGKKELYISHADCIGDAELLAEAVRAIYPDAEITVNLMAPALAAHAGPGGLALFFAGKRPKSLIRRG